MKNQSIEQLENDIWKTPANFSSSMIEKCHGYRKISISKLTVEQLRLLISQKIGVKYLIGIAIEKLNRDILSGGDLYEGDLLMAVSNLTLDFWSIHRTEYQSLKKIVELNSDLIKRELGKNKFDQICKNTFPQ